MPFREVSIVSARRELVQLALQAGANIRELCRRFGISPTTAYHWIGRFRENGERGLHDGSRRPKRSPNKSSADVEARILTLRNDHPAWGAPTIAVVLEREFGIHRAQSTVHAILRRNGRIDPAASDRAGRWQRFEKEAANELWQMDFKGDFATTNEGRCYPLTVLDDYSRYSLVLSACRDQRMTTVQPLLIGAFRRYGMPLAMLTDNGNPWGNASAGHPYTKLTVWMIRLGITPLHSRPLHPQTMGKDERFHRTFKAEVLGTRQFGSHDEVQAVCDRWREMYNSYRPHRALGNAVPATRYVMSPRSYPEVLPPLEYASDDVVQSISSGGMLRFRGRKYFFCEAFHGQQLAVRPTLDDEQFDLYYAHVCVGRLDLRAGMATPHSSRRQQQHSSEREDLPGADAPA
jgi:transposase InsO family protein